MATGAGNVLGTAASWAVVAGLAVLTLVLAVVARTRAGRRLSYDAWAARSGQPASRDLRIDLLRGVAICFVVVNHLFLPSLTALLSEEPVRGVAAGTAVVRDVVVAMFFLDIGPGQVNILGLYVVLLLLAPAFVWLLRRRAWAPLLALSTLVWLFGRTGPTRIFPSEFEDAFPLLTWQLLFVIGLVVGWHRARLLDAARSAWGRVVLWLLILVGLAEAVFSWNNPYLSNRFDVRLSLIADDRFREWYEAWFSRSDLAPGRVVAVICGVVTGYALLSAYWVPIRRAVAWFLVPLGQNTLYVFVLHVFVLLAVNEIGFDDRSVLIGTLVDVAALLVLWTCVRTRFLFGIVPR